MRALILALLLVMPAAAGAQWGGSAVNGAGLFSPGVCLTLRNADGTTSLQFCPQSASPGANATTAWMDYDGSALMQFNVPTGDGFRWYAGGTALMTLSATGTITSEAAAGANAFLCTAQAKCLCLNGSCTAYVYENASGEIAVFVGGGERVAFTGGNRIKIAGDVSIMSTSGAPEGAVTSNDGSLMLRNDGGTGTTLYVKESGTGNTGWRAVTPLKGTTTTDPAPVAAATCAVTSVTVTGAAAGMGCYAIAPATLATNMSATCIVTGANTAGVKLCNHQAAGNIDPPNGVYGAEVRQ